MAAWQGLLIVVLLCGGVASEFTCDSGSLEALCMVNTSRTFDAQV